MKVLFLGKREDGRANAASIRLQSVFPNTECIFAKRGDPVPDNLQNWEGDYLISYLWPWVISGDVLSKAGRAAINFHPGPPEYPGIGCTNFALYNEETDFGVTCHYMAAKVDTGSIIRVSRFPLFASDSVQSLTERCYQHLFTLFEEIMVHLKGGSLPPPSDEHWTRKPYRRKELDALGRITQDMDDCEIQRRVRAVTFPGYPGAYVERDGIRVPYDREPSLDSRGDFNTHTGMERTRV
jgi:methionyl-tRNA formyltransferase